MKRCSVCNEEKPLDDFMWQNRATGKRDGYCRVCRAAYKQWHYAENKDRYKANATAYTARVYRERTLWLLNYFETHPCVDCGENDPVVLEFDHREGKDFEIADGMRAKNWQAVLAEMAKCDVRCANCHRRKTAYRGGFARAGVAQLARARPFQG